MIFIVPPSKPSGGSGTGTRISLPCAFSLFFVVRDGAHCSTTQIQPKRIEQLMGVSTKGPWGGKGDEATRKLCIYPEAPLLVLQIVKFRLVLRRIRIPLIFCWVQRGKKVFFDAVGNKMVTVHNLVWGQLLRDTSYSIGCTQNDWMLQLQVTTAWGGMPEKSFIAVTDYSHSFNFWIFAGINKHVFCLCAAPFSLVLPPHARLACDWVELLQIQNLVPWERVWKQFRC